MQHSNNDSGSSATVSCRNARQQLTWMDARVDDREITARIGKPVEINALWYNALECLERTRALDPSYPDLEETLGTVRDGLRRTAY